MRSVLFPGSGKILVRNSTGYLFDAIEVQSVEFDVGVEAQNIPDGNGLFDIMRLYTKRTGSIKITTNLLDPAALAVLWGATLTESRDITAWVVGEEKTIPAVGPFTVTLDKAPNNTTAGLFVRDIDGILLTRTASTPTTGQYSVSGNTLTFTATDANKALVISYSYAVTGATTIEVSATSEPRPFQIIHSFTAKDRSGSFYDAMLDIPRVLPAGNMPMRAQREAQTFDINAEIMRPDGGLNPVTFAFKKRP